MHHHMMNRISLIGYYYSLQYNTSTHSSKLRHLKESDDVIVDRCLEFKNITALYEMYLFNVNIY